MPKEPAPMNKHVLSQVRILLSNALILCSLCG